MTLEEYKKLLSATLQPDTQAEAIMALTDALQNDITALQAMQGQKLELENTIASLRDSNSKLVLRITEPVVAQEIEKEQTPEEARESLIAFLAS